MAFEDVDEREARRVAAALGLEQWDAIYGDVSDQCVLFNAERDGLWFEYVLFLSDENGWSLAIKDFEESDPLEGDVFAQIGTYRDQLDIQSQLPEEATGNTVLTLLLRATYLLGQERATEALEEHFGLSLSHHEKIELRLTMPRAFWPQTWLNEEGA